MKIFNYKRFFLFERFKEDDNDNNDNIIYSDTFLSILNQIDDKISKDLINLKKNNISYIDTTEKNDYVSFILIKNIKDDVDPWKSNSRQHLKIGRFINKLLDNINSKDLEKFVNLYKSIYDFNRYAHNFEIVKGDDITKYYNCRNQVRKIGSVLSKSCMGTDDQTKLISSFYGRNPKKIKMLILKDDKNPDLIVGRANLWYLDVPENKIFMDRIYASDDYLVNIFIQFAKNNNFIYKSKQIYGGNVVPVVYNGKEQKIIMSTFLKKLNYKYYPYVDTLQFYNKKTGEITNDTSKWNITSDDEWIALIHAGGNYLTVVDNYGFKMDYMGRLIHPYYVVWSKIDNCYIHKEDAIYLEYLMDYCVPERDIVNIDGFNYLKEDVYFDEETKTYKKK